MNILFTTTKQWNVGDEVILRGIRNLIGTRIPRHTYLPWNRHPGIRPGNSFRDNSFDELRHSFAAVDYTVFAGSPEWSGPRLEPLLNLILQSGKRCAFIGIGSSNPRFHQSDALRRVLRHHTDAVTCRDQCTYDMLSGLVDPGRLFLLPCPSIFHATALQPRDRLQVIGLNYQATATKWNNITESEHEYMLGIFQGLAREFEVRIICNYIDDVVGASRFFPRDWLRYSPDHAEFQEFYTEIDALIGTRVHGCMAAVSRGLPSWLINNTEDLRREGVIEQIPDLRSVVNETPGQVAEMIKQVSVSETQQSITRFKASTLERFQPVLDLIKMPPRPEPEATKSGFLHSAHPMLLRRQKFFRLLQELPDRLASELKRRASERKS